jgi:hypothetical protein
MIGQRENDFPRQVGNGRASNYTSESGHPDSVRNGKLVRKEFFSYLPLKVFVALAFLCILSFGSAASALGAPVIAALSATSGPQGSTITISGENFGLTQGCCNAMLGATPLMVSLWTDTEIRAAVPSVPSATYDVTVVTNIGISNAVAFQVVEPLPPSPPAPPAPTFGNNSACVAIYAPAVVPAGTSFPAWVMMQNIGTKYWASSGTNPHRLATVRPQWSNTWGVNDVSLPYSPIATNDSAVFTFTATAPLVPGTYNFGGCLKVGGNWGG